jgi:eukaryotic-like serine/threonine-protein kinase
MSPVPGNPPQPFNAAPGRKADPENVAPSALRITFTVIAGPHQGKVFQFVGHDTFMIGRGKQAHFRLPKKDEYFSRVHFLVEMNPPYCRLLDMDSVNGTFVNGQRVDLADLHDGDLIQGGQTVLRVSLESEPEPAAGVLSAERATPEPPSAPAAASGAEALPASAADISSLPPEVSGPVIVACPLCGASPPPNEEQPTAVGPALCAGCEEGIRGQPQPIPGFRLVRELGRGGMGVVHLAVRSADGAVVALKTIRPTGDAPVAVERFLREADILRQLTHPRIVAFREMGEADDGQLFFAMDYVRGTDAARLVKKYGPLPIAGAVDLVCQLLEALAYAHAQGFVHRDVKPANVLVTRADGHATVHLADFGLARTYQASPLSGLTVLGQVGGTVAFMAPEQVTHFREAKPPVDQYAAAATLYHLLTGHFVFDFPSQPQKRMLMLLQDEPVPLQTRRPEVPENLAGVLHRALAKEPEQRFADVTALREALLPWKA